MRQCLVLAQQAADHAEVPVGAMLVRDGAVLASSPNRSIELTDPTAHAEILCLRQAADVERNYRLPGTVLYTTLEPCLMCAGALLHARVATLVYGASEPRGGVVSNTPTLLSSMTHFHKLEVIGGVLAADCRDLVQVFFRARR